MPAGLPEQSDDQLHAMLNMNTLESENGNNYGRLVVDTQRFCLYVAALYNSDEYDPKRDLA